MTSTSTCSSLSSIATPFFHLPHKLPKPPLSLIPFTPLCTSNPKTNTQTKPSSMDSNSKTPRPKSKPRKKSSYGTSRRSILKKSFNQEQVSFTTPFPDDPVVGIIGGGLSGLVCALYLGKNGINSTVFDTVRAW